MKKTFAFLWLIAASCFAGEMHFWGTFIQNGSLSKNHPKLHYFAEAQGRISESGTFQPVLRPALKYQLSERSSLWLGYAWMPVFPKGASMIDEHRLWQQFLFQDRRHLELRTRIEQRVRNTGNDVGLLVRQMLLFYWDLDPQLRLIVSDEIFYEMWDTDWGAENGIRENRAFVGLRYPLGEVTQLIGGYQHRWMLPRGPNQSIHVTSFWINTRL